jgi:competence protein ComEC
MTRPPVATPAGWRVIALCGAFTCGVSLAAVARAPVALCIAVGVIGAGASAAMSSARATRVLLPLLAGLVCAVGVARGTQVTSGASALVDATHGGPAVLLGTVREGTGSRRSAAQVVVDVDRVVHSDGDLTLHAGVLATLHTGPAVLPGDSVRLDVAGLRPPGSDAAGAILVRDGIDAVARSPMLTLQAEGGPSPARMLAVLRARLGSAVDAALPEPAASLVQGIVFGIHRPLAPDITTGLQDAGLAHILAISGLKVVLVAGLVSALCGALALSPRLRLLLTASAVGGYVVLCGATPAAVRSAVMAGAGWGLQGTGRSPDPLPLLAATATAMLLVDPGLCRDAGFQLSFLGTLGIVLLAGPLAHRLPGPRLLREPFAVTLAAQVVTVPVMAATFGVVSLVGPLANALALPLLPPLIVSGAGGALLSLLVPGLGAAVLAVAGGLALVIGGVATRAAMLPFAALHVASWPAIYVVAEAAAVGAALLVWLAMRRHMRSRPIGPLIPAAIPRSENAPQHGAPPPLQRARRFLLLHRFAISRRGGAILAGGVALATGLTVVVAGSRPDGRLHVAVLDVGGARAEVIRTATGGNALVDTGSDPQRLVQSLGPALPPLTRSLGLLVLTGGDRTAVGGLAGVIDRYSIDRAVVPKRGLGSAVRTTLATLHDRGAEVVPAAPDSAWTWGGATWWLLSPDGMGAEGSALKVADSSGRAVLLGNLTVVAQEELAALRSGQLAADLLVAPPAGTVAPALADAVRPRLVAIPDARSTSGSARTRLLSGPGVRHTADAGTLTYIGSDGGLLAT